jgi:hypothetical protein
MLLALVPAYAAIAEGGECHDSGECRSVCQAERQDCRQAAWQAVTTCREGDDGCRRECKGAFRRARAECHQSRIACRVTCRDDVDAACADSCLDGFDLCRDDAASCATDCREDLADALRSCVESEGGLRCVREARREHRECTRSCYEGLGCRSELHECVQGCVIEDDAP